MSGNTSSEKSKVSRENRALSESSSRVRLSLPYILNSSASGSSSHPREATADFVQRRDDNALVSGIRRSRESESASRGTAGSADSLFRTSSSHAAVQRTLAGDSLSSTFACPECGKNFRTKAEVENHRRAVHPRGTHSCPHCSLSYSLRGNLNKHIKSKHEKRRPHKCSYCGADFAFSDGLRRHIGLVHTSETTGAPSESRPHKCTICGAAFKQRTHLAKHTNAVHSYQKQETDKGSREAGPSGLHP